MGGARLAGHGRAGEIVPREPGQGAGHAGRHAQFPDPGHFRPGGVWRCVREDGQRAVGDQREDGGGRGGHLDIIDPGFKMKAGEAYMHQR